jgi:uncharacterized protein (DUF885 family)
MSYNTLSRLSLTLFWFALSASAAPQAEMDRLVDEYLAAHFTMNPSAATAAGVHDHDARLEDWTKTGRTARTEQLERFKKRFGAIAATGLTPESALDLELVRSQIDAALLDLREVRFWERNPDFYGTLVNTAIYGLISRDFAPAPERMKLVIAREEAALGVLEAGKKNLKNPPRIYTEVALEQLPGMKTFLENDVPAALKAVTDPKLVAEFKRSNTALIGALTSWETFLKTSVLPKSKGDFALGTNLFKRKLLYEEMVDIPLDKLLEIGKTDLAANQAAFKEVAQKLDPKRTVAEVLDALQKDHPEPGKLLDTVRSTTSQLKRFAQDRHIITLPAATDPIVQETPSFERALFFASLDAPGPFETKATEAYYNVTPPESTWSKEKVEEHMTGFGFGVITSTSIHEAFPGHFTQFVWLPFVKSKARKVFYANSNVEGWAHYVEQMVLDEGYGGGDLKLRLGQLQDALLRNARFIVGIRMHTQKMSYGDGISFFQKEGYLSRANAERETKRGTSDPTYLYYTLGKLQILKLREDYKKLKGDKFELRAFHDDFMKQGGAPIKIVRKALLGDESPPL